MPDRGTTDPPPRRSARRLRTGRWGRGMSVTGATVDGGRIVGSRVLVAGWFSWDDCAATAGDYQAMNVDCTWLDRVGRAYDVACESGVPDGVDWRSIKPQDYSDLVFVCGPIHRTTPWHELERRFPGARKIGLDVTMIEPVSDWNPFDVLLERDSDRGSRPDLVFAARESLVPVLGLVLVEPYAPEYPSRDMQPAARQAAEALAYGRPAACVRIDTVIKSNQTGLRSPAEVESLIARMDAVVTTRLHGLVMALKNGVPAVVIDPVAGGSKLLRQAQAVGWPAVRTGDALAPAQLESDLDFCLSDEGRSRAKECANRAALQLAELEQEFRAVMAHGPPPQ